jgi:hypothetical protein
MNSSGTSRRSITKLQDKSNGGKKKTIAKKKKTPKKKTPKKKGSAKKNQPQKPA